MYFKRIFFILFLFSGLKAFTQDVDFHLNAQLLPAKNILKVKRDFHDPYLWVLAQNNEVYRINSLTLAVEDLTSQFAAYSGLQFIDIAGRSQDTVFIATNSANVLEYKKGLVKVIGTADGMPGIVNSIGIDNSRQGLAYPEGEFIAFFATDHGIVHYNYKSEILIPAQFDHDSRIFEASYRTDLLWDGQFCRCFFTYPEPIPIIQYYNYGTYGGEVWLGGDYGNVLKTAFNTSASAYSNADVYGSFVNQFWATDKGLFQNFWVNSQDPTRPHKKYLEGKDITKITSIFGMLSFSNYSTFGRAKENLLVGTTTGLYFSDSHYQGGLLPEYSFNQYTQLGNVAVNDICVNANTYTYRNFSQEICEDGAWVATAKGLYLLKPDWGKYINTNAQIDAIQFTGQPLGTAELTICDGSTAKLAVSMYVYGGHTVQWYKNGQELAGKTGTELEVNESGDYSAVVYDPCDAAIHFASNQLKVKVISAPVFTFDYPDKNAFCDGVVPTFKVEGDPLYEYRWYKDGVLNGNTTHTLDVTEAGKYKVEVSACQGTWVPSKEIEVAFVKLPTLALGADKPAYCIGEQATLSVNIPVDPAYNIIWAKDFITLPGNTNKTSLVTDVAGNYSVKIIGTQISCLASALPVALTFSPPPAISIEKIVNTTLCSGQVVDLKATFTGGTVRWSTGETGNRIGVKTAGRYTATVTSPSGCTDSRSIDVEFFDNPVLAVPDATLCSFTKQQITLSAPPGFSKYVWNGTRGTDTYTTASLGKVELEVTDNNGCTASQTISITSSCADIGMANTFTPNGDGINDTWVIEGLDNSASVKVYNRFGALVFESLGYTKPWDGTYKSRKLPAGTYYYVLAAKAGTQVLSGWVSVIY